MKKKCKSLKKNCKSFSANCFVGNIEIQSIVHMNNRKLTKVAKTRVSYTMLYFDIRFAHKSFHKSRLVKMGKDVEPKNRSFVT